jgi:succinate dehydrogenase / fumarate reductase cytochrome b subunit
MSEHAERPARADRDFVRRKLFSFIGLVPMGLYVVLHLVAHSAAWLGAHVWEERLHDWHDSPFYWPVVVAFIYLPFAFHSVYGLILALRGRPTGSGGLTSFGYVKYVLQRLSAVGVLLFLGAHVYKTRIEPALQGAPLDFDHMVEAMHHAPTLIVYALGVLGVAFHLANGLWLSGITWGLTVSRTSQRAWQAWTIAAFVVIAAMGFVAMWGFGRVSMFGHAGQAGLDSY